MKLIVMGGGNTFELHVIRSPEKDKLELAILISSLNM